MDNCKVNEITRKDAYSIPRAGDTVNDKSYTREKFCDLMGFVIMLGKLL